MKNKMRFCAKVKQKLEAIFSALARSKFNFRAKRRVSKFNFRAETGFR